MNGIDSNNSEFPIVFLVAISNEFLSFLEKEGYIKPEYYDRDELIDKFIGRERKSDEDR
jgi:hypothetical protein